MLTDLFDAEAIREMHTRYQEHQLRQRRSDETQLHEPIDAFAELHPLVHQTRTPAWKPLETLFLSVSTFDDSIQRSSVSQA